LDAFEARRSAAEVGRADKARLFDMRSLSREMRSYADSAAACRRFSVGDAKICDFMEYGLRLLPIVRLSNPQAIIELGPIQLLRHRRE